MSFDKERGATIAFRVDVDATCHRASAIISERLGEAGGGFVTRDTLVTVDTKHKTRNAL